MTTDEKEWHKDQVQYFALRYTGASDEQPTDEQIALVFSTRTRQPKPYLYPGIRRLVGKWMAEEEQYLKGRTYAVPYPSIRTQELTI